MTLVKTRNGASTDLIDQMFESFFDWQLPARFTYGAIPFDLYEFGGKYVIEMATPGFEAKEIHVEVTGATVTITGRHEQTTEAKDVRYHRREIRRGSFARTVTLPQDLDANAVTATIEKGILKVELMPIKPIAPKTIEVKSV